jgi:hypothetical protein
MKTERERRAGACFHRGGAHTLFLGGAVTQHRADRLSQAGRWWPPSGNRVGEQSSANGCIGESSPGRSDQEGESSYKKTKFYFIIL